jgi:predicted lipoprotein with Yx(FWY)xxD motif
MRSRRIRIIVPPLLVGVAAAAAGCGGSSHSSSSAAAAPAKSSTASATRAAATPSGAAGTPVLITTKHAKGLGTILAAGHKQLTVYMFEGDRRGASACTGACASVWPPVTGRAGVAGTAMSADLGTISRAGGTTQVTYHGHPLYFFVKDKDDGDAYGEGVKAFGADWYALTPTGGKVDKS